MTTMLRYNDGEFDWVEIEGRRYKLVDDGPTDAEVHKHAIGFLHDSNFVEPGKLINLDFSQAIKTFVGGANWMKERMKK